MTPCSTNDKAMQIERDFGLAHPLRRLRVGLNRRDKRTVTPLQATVIRDRWNEIVERGFTGEEAAVILMMRGSRREAVCTIYKCTPLDLDELVFQTLKNRKTDDLVEEAMRLWNLGAHA